MVCFFSANKKNKRVGIMAVLRNVDTKELPEENMGIVKTKDTAKGEASLPLISIVYKMVMYQGFVQNHTCFVHISTILNM
jgi:hypothetical protein